MNSQAQEDVAKSWQFHERVDRSKYSLLLHPIRVYRYICKVECYCVPCRQLITVMCHFQDCLITSHPGMYVPCLNCELRLMWHIICVLCDLKENPLHMIMYSPVVVFTLVLI